MSKSVVPTMVAVLAPYLSARSAEWLANPGGGPTLPFKRESGAASIHVRQLVRELGFNPEWRQHFRKQELRDMVNATCLEQGLVGIGEVAVYAAELATSEACGSRVASAQLADVHAALLDQSLRIAELEGVLALAQSQGVLLRADPPSDP